MADHKPQRRTNIGEAAWAHNRWPTIGLYAGAGVGLVLGIVRLAGWLLTIVHMVGLAVGGCALGMLMAAMMYRSTDWGTQDDQED